MLAQISEINDLFWNATRFSDVLKVDRRVVAQALETVPSQTRNGNRVWHVRDGFWAIAERVGSKKKLDPNTMDPKEQLDYYRAQREKIKLAEDLSKLVPAADVERRNGEICKIIVQTIDALPDILERDCALPLNAVALVQNAVDALRDTVYQRLRLYLDGGDSNDG